MSEYDQFLQRVQRRFEQVEGPIFTTNAMGLFDAYLAAFPDSERQYHNCNACRRFIESYGGLVNQNGESVLWDIAEVPFEYVSSVGAMLQRIDTAKITGVFLTSEKTLGLPSNRSTKHDKYWTHYAVQVPEARRYKERAVSAEQKQAELRQDYQILSRALSEFTVEGLQLAIRILESDTLARDKKFQDQAQWLLDALRTRKARGQSSLWPLVATAPAGWCHPRSSMIGTLLEDIDAGLPLETIRDRWNKKMHPLQYQRPQAAPTEGNLDQAEKLIEKLGVRAALRRRYALASEVPAIWRPAAPAKGEDQGTVFGHLRKRSEAAQRVLQIPGQTQISWEKFAEKVLPEACTLELYVPTAAFFGAITTAVNADAPDIFQWKGPFAQFGIVPFSTPKHWGLQPDWTPIAQISHPARAPHAEVDAALLILEGAKGADARSLALFPEALKSDFHPIRASIEALSKSGKMEDAPPGQVAAGLWIGTGGFGRTIRATNASGDRRTFVIDRWA